MAELSSCVPLSIPVCLSPFLGSGPKMEQAHMLEARPWGTRPEFVRPALFTGPPETKTQSRGLGRVKEEQLLSTGSAHCPSGYGPP